MFINHSLSLFFNNLFITLQTIFFYLFLIRLINFFIFSLEILKKFLWIIKFIIRKLKYKISK